jgi:hypothetical protein
LTKEPQNTFYVSKKRKKKEEKTNLQFAHRQKASRVKEKGLLVSCTIAKLYLMYVEALIIKKYINFGLGKRREKEERQGKANFSFGEKRKQKKMKKKGPEKGFL